MTESHDRPRPPPVLVLPSSDPNQPSKQAVIIFLHGFGGQGADFEYIAQKAKSTHRLEHAAWIFPNAIEDVKTKKPAWSSLAGIVPSSSGTTEAQDKQGMLLSMRYIESIVDEQTAKGLDSKRVVIAGFSQGCALSILMCLVSKYAGRFAGVAGIAGYMPLSDEISEMRKELNSPEVKQMPFLVMRGTNDNVIPSKFRVVPHLEDLGHGDMVESKEYELDHNLSDEVVDDLLTWLEKVIP